MSPPADAGPRKRDFPTLADILMMCRPRFWHFPRASELYGRRMSASVSLLALAGLDPGEIAGLEDEGYDARHRRLIVGTGLDARRIPLFRATNHLVRGYASARGGHGGPLFRNELGNRISAQNVAKPLRNAARLLGLDRPLVEHFRELFHHIVERDIDIAGVEREQHIDAILAITGATRQGETSSPVSATPIMAAVIEAKDPMAGDMRFLDRDELVLAKVEELGGSDLPFCLWDLAMTYAWHGPVFGKLPPEHQLLLDLRALGASLPLKGARRTRVLHPAIAAMLPRIDALMTERATTIAQLADALGCPRGSLAHLLRRLRHKARGTVPKTISPPSEIMLKPLTRDDRRFLDNLRKENWPRVGKPSFRQNLIDDHLPRAAAMVDDDKLHGAELAPLFKLERARIYELLGDLKRGIAPLSVTAGRRSSPERAEIRRLVVAALEEKSEAQPVAELSRDMRRAGVDVTPEFIWNVARMKPLSKPDLTADDKIVMEKLSTAELPRRNAGMHKQRMVDEHLPYVADMVRSHKICGEDAASLFRVHRTTMYDLINDLECGSPPTVQTVPRPGESFAEVRAIVRDALEKRAADISVAVLTRRLRKDHDLVLSSQYVRDIEAVMRKERTTAETPSPRRRARKALGRQAKGADVAIA